MEALTQQRVKMQPKAEDLQADMSGRQKKIDALQKRINDVKDRVFADFSRKVGSAGPDALEQGAAVVPLVSHQPRICCRPPVCCCCQPPVEQVSTGIHVGSSDHLW